MAKLKFQQALLQSSVSNNPSEILHMGGYGVQVTFLIIMINFIKQFYCLIFMCQPMCVTEYIGLISISHVMKSNISLDSLYICKYKRLNLDSTEKLQNICNMIFSC